MATLVGAEQVSAKGLATPGIWGSVGVLVPFGYPGFSPGKIKQPPELGSEGFFIGQQYLKSR
jgi:hypothetical protein